ncbi:hypothetical protein SCHPADRAFT_948107 [Schizopora paradoxa]|uniref:Uncharacterized protein n=1 Tax=Schizopora paradoxa TaxID=27342 RepID=A0A0H2QWP6_9AGAM|nr:hypothetical protein SCHPADRAFT_948107 [Schizopora paradoxa]
MSASDMSYERNQKDLKQQDPAADADFTSLAPEIWRIIIELLAGYSREDVLNVCLVGEDFPLRREHIFRYPFKESYLDISNLGLSCRFLCSQVLHYRRTFPQFIVTKSPVEHWIRLVEDLREGEVTHICKWVFVVSYFSWKHVQFLKAILETSARLSHVHANLFLSGGRGSVRPKLQAAIKEVVEKRWDQLESVEWSCDRVEILLGVRRASRLSSLDIDGAPGYSESQVRAAIEDPKTWGRLENLVIDWSCPWPVVDLEDDSEAFSPCRILECDFFPRLRLLKLHYKIPHDTTSITSIISHSPLLETLVLHGIRDMEATPHLKQSDTDLHAPNVVKLALDSEALSHLGLGFAPKTRRLFLLKFGRLRMHNFEKLQPVMVGLFDVIRHIKERMPATLQELQIDGLSVPHVQSMVWDSEIREDFKNVLQDLTKRGIKVLDEMGEVLLPEHYFSSTRTKREWEMHDYRPPLQHWY